MDSLKELLKSKFPTIYTKYDNIKNSIRVKIYNKPNDVVFENIYKSNLWEDSESISGPGSSKASTMNFSHLLIEIIEKYNIKVFIDAPCGDYNWMKEVKLPVEKYLGFDIVEDLVIKNKQKFSTSDISFDVLDITKNILPEGDIIFCRDCLIHLSNDRIKNALRNFKKSNSKYLLTTTYLEVPENKDILTGEWRKINPELSPFNLPKPIELIYENCKTADRNGELSRDKYLGLWELKSINI